MKEEKYKLTKEVYHCLSKNGKLTPNFFVKKEVVLENATFQSCFDLLSCIEEGSLSEGNEVEREKGFLAKITKTDGFLVGKEGMSYVVEENYFNIEKQVGS